MLCYLVHILIPLKIQLIQEKLLPCIKRNANVAGDTPMPNLAGCEEQQRHRDTLEVSEGKELREKSVKFSDSLWPTNCLPEMKCPLELRTQQWVCVVATVEELSRVGGYLSGQRGEQRRQFKISLRAFPLLLNLRYLYGVSRRGNSTVPPCTQRLRFCCLY